MTIPVTLIWSTLNRFVSSVSSVLNLGLQIGQEIFKQISDRRLPTLSLLNQIEIEQFEISSPNDVTLLNVNIEVLKVYTTLYKWI